MKLTTRRFAAFKSVGDQGKQIEVMEGSIMEIVKWMAMQMMENPMRKRFDFSIAPDQDAAKLGVMRDAKPSKSLRVQELLSSELEGLFANLKDSDDGDDE